MKKFIMLTAIVSCFAIASSANAHPSDLKDHLKIEVGLQADPASVMNADFSFPDRPAIIVVGCEDHDAIASVAKAIDTPFVLVTSFADERPPNEKGFLLSDIPLPSLTAIEARLKASRFKDVFIQDDFDRPISDWLPQYEKPANTSVIKYKGFSKPPALRIRSSI